MSQEPFFHIPLLLFSQLTKFEGFFEISSKVFILSSFSSIQKLTELFHFFSFQQLRLLIFDYLRRLSMSISFIRSSPPVYFATQEFFNVYAPKLQAQSIPVASSFDSIPGSVVLVLSLGPDLPLVYKFLLHFEHEDIACICIAFSVSLSSNFHF